MNPLSITRRLATAVALVVVVGCATDSPTAADRMRGHADDQSELAQQWENGKELVKSGNRKIENGEQMVEEGRELIEQGNNEVAEGRTMVRDAERRFRAQYPDLEIDADE